MYSDPVNEQNNILIRSKRTVHYKQEDSLICSNENTPDFKYVGKILFIFVDAINFFTGSPIFIAMIPAVRFPKFPEGTEMTTSSVFFN